MLQEHTLSAGTYFDSVLSYLQEVKDVLLDFYQIVMGCADEASDDSCCLWQQSVGAVCREHAQDLGSLQKRLFRPLLPS